MFKKIVRRSSRHIQPKKLNTADLLAALGLAPSVMDGTRALEPRILLDAAGFETADSLADQAAGEAAEAWAAAFDLQQPVEQSELSAFTQVLLPDTQYGAPATSLEIAFVDAGVEGRDAIIAAFGPDVEVHVLVANRDGVEQIADILATRSGIDAIHIVSHGRSGTLDLGDAKLTEASMAGRHADEMAVIRDALSHNADILIYGCDFAAGSRGHAAVQALADATGADIAASEDLTGAAALGGDWDLEDATGAIEARLLDAPEWNGVLAPLVISITGSPSLTGTTGTNAITLLPEGGVGHTALWINAGTVGGSPIDLRATVIALSASTVSFITQGDDASIVINGGATASIRWEIFAAGTSQTIAAVGSPNFRITDIDGVGGVPNTRETVSPQLAGLTAYTVDSPSNLVASTSGAGVQVTGTQNQNGEATSLTAFTWQNVSSWQVNYTLNPASGFANAVFRHDGDGDFLFVAPVSVSLLGLDLDGNESAAAGTAYQATYSENAAGIPISDVDTVISQNNVLGANIGSATIVLTNAQAGDVLAVGALPAGITASIDASVAGTIRVTITGSDTVANYQTAIKAVSFANSSQSPVTVDRNIEVSVTNTSFGTTSNTAISTIHVMSVNDVPIDLDETNTVTEDTTLTIVNGAAGDLLNNTTDPDGPAATITGYAIFGIAGIQPVGSAVSIPGVGAITINANGSYSFAPLLNYAGTIPVITYTVSDSTLTDTSTLTLSMLAVNDPPVIDLDNNNSSNTTGAGLGANFEFTYIENATPAPIVDISDFTLTDIDSQIVEMVVTLTDGQIGDTVNFPSVMPGGVTASVVPGATLTAPGTIVLSFTGTAATTLANWNALLAAITFTPSTHDVHNPDPADRHITVQTSDANGASSNTATATIHVVPENDPPTLDLDLDNSTLNAGNALVTYIENGPPLFLHSGVLTTDLDDTSYETAQIIHTNQQTGDQISINGTVVMPGSAGAVGGIAYSVSTNLAGQLVIDFTGTASIASYTNALQSIAFSNTSENPSAMQRQITMQVNDGDNDSPVRTAFVTVTPVNDAPIAQDDNETTTEESSLSQSVLPDNGNGPDSDVDSSTLTVAQVNGAAFASGSVITLPSGALLTMNSDGTYNYNPNGQFNGLGVGDTATDSFTYQLSDESLGDTATVTITVTGVNDVPDAQNDSEVTGENTNITDSVLSDNGSGADADPDGDPLAVNQVNGAAFTSGGVITLPSGAQLTMNGDGTYAYNPNGRFDGLGIGESTSDSFTYQISDGQGGSDIATVMITLNGANDAPVVSAPIPDAAGQDAQTGISIDVSTAFTDPDNNDTLSYSASGLPLGLVIDTNTGLITGTIDNSASQNGNTGAPANGLYTIVVTADDGNGGTVTDTFSYTVTNPAPDAVDDAFTVFEGSGTSGNVLSPNPLTSDIDPDGDLFTVTQVNGASGNVGVVLAGSDGGQFFVAANGAFTFGSGSDFEDLAVGEIRTTAVTYQISDGEGGTDTATVTVTVVGINDAPVVSAPIPDAAGQDAQTGIGIDVSTAFTDPDSNDTLSYSASGLPLGLVIDTNTGLITGTIDNSASQNGNTGAPANGLYTIVVTADDGNGGTVTDTFSYTVTNPAPVAQDDGLTGNEDTTVIGLDVFANNSSGVDADPDGDTFHVSQVNGQPGNVATPVAGSNGGLFTLNSDGTLDFDPDGDFEGLAVGQTAATTITYQISDGEGGTSTATITFTVTGVNDVPVPVNPLEPGAPPVDPDAYIPPQIGLDNAPSTPLDVTQYATDPDAGEILTFTINPSELPAGLTFDGTTISGIYDPSASQGGPNNDGIYPVTLTVDDGNGGTFTTTIVFDVGNPPPVAQDDAVATPEDDAVNGNVFADNGNGIDNDPDNDAFTVTAVGGLPANVGTPLPGTGGGQFTINPDGSYTFDPGTDFNGLDVGETGVSTVTYTITDADGAQDMATLTLTINGANDTPVIIDPTDPGTPDNPAPAPDPLNIIPDVATSDGTPLAPIDVSAFVVDPDGEPLAYGLDLAVPAWIVIDPVSGIITGTPPADASQMTNTGTPGEYRVTITATDPDGAIATTTVTLTVANIAPVAADDAAAVSEDGPALTGNVISGAGTDTDGAPDSDALTVTLAEQAGNPVPIGTPFVTAGGGVLTLNADGSYTFDPGTAYNGLDADESATETLTYTLDDGNGGTDTATLTLTINGANDTPPPDPIHKTPLPDRDDPIDDTGVSPPSLIVDRAVNLVRPLGYDTGIFGKYPVTEAVSGASLLNPGTNFDPADHPVTRTVNWISQTRDLLSRSVMQGTDGAGMTPWMGGDSETVLAGEDLVVRTLVWQGVVYAEFLTQSQMPLTPGIGSFETLPAWARMVAPNLMAIRPPAATGDLLLSLAAQDGSRIEFRLDTSGGIIEVQADRQGQLFIPANLNGLPDQLGTAPDYFYTNRLAVQG